MRNSVLTIAGSDSGGGAGIQADLRTFAAYGVHGLAAVTALTAQNTRGVLAVGATAPRLIEAQCEALAADFRIGAVKVGMLGDRRTIRAVAGVLRGWPGIPVVLDPVMVASSGARLLDPRAVHALVDELLPRADLVTPNLPEAEVLAGRPVRRREDYEPAIEALRARGARGILLKGGHLPRGDVHDLLDLAGRRWLHRHRRLARAGHGTGCTLSSAIAAQRARGVTWPRAVQDAVDYVHGALRAGLRPGRGEVVVLDHFWRMRGG